MLNNADLEKFRDCTEVQIFSFLCDKIKTNLDRAITEVRKNLNSVVVDSCYERAQEQIAINKDPEKELENLLAYTYGHIAIDPNLLAHEVARLRALARIIHQMLNPEKKEEAPMTEQATATKEDPELNNLLIAQEIRRISDEYPTNATFMEALESTGVRDKISNILPDDLSEEDMRTVEQHCDAMRDVIIVKSAYGIQDHSALTLQMAGKMLHELIDKAEQFRRLDAGFAGIDATEGTPAQA